MTWYSTNLFYVKLSFSVTKLPIFIFYLRVHPFILFLLFKKLHRCLKYTTVLIMVASMRWIMIFVLSSYSLYLTTNRLPDKTPLWDRFCITVVIKFADRFHIFTRSPKSSISWWVKSWCRLWSVSRRLLVGWTRVNLLSLLYDYVRKTSIISFLHYIVNFVNWLHRFVYLTNG